MKAYSLTVNIKLGLLLFAVAIAMASLVYTDQLVDRLRERERASVSIWAGAYEQLGAGSSFNPYQQAYQHLDQLLDDLLSESNQYLSTNGFPSRDTLRTLRRAVAWAQTMPPADTYVSSIIIDDSSYFNIPAIVVDSLGQPIIWHNLSIPDTITVSSRDSLRVRQRAAKMAEVFRPIAIEIGSGLKQYVHYGESDLIKELRIYPYLQLIFIGLFVLVGYLGFSYVRRSEQRSLWVGMAREAAHQLGTPISSLMGWLELLRQPEVTPDTYETALDEVGKDIERLKRVTNRFSDIGSLPKVDVLPLAPVIASTADYMRRRIPTQGKQVALEVSVEEGLRVPLNTELFEWVIENLLKNALDALEQKEGKIQVRAFRENGKVFIDVQDNGKGIDRRQWKNVFRPGYSTKKRGWGLGLSLAKRIVEDYHGGTLSLVQSKVGHGTTFRIALQSV